MNVQCETYERTESVKNKGFCFSANRKQTPSIFLNKD